MDDHAKYKSCFECLLLLTEKIEKLENELYMAKRVIKNLPQEIKEELFKDKTQIDGIAPADKFYMN